MNIIYGQNLNDKMNIAEIKSLSVRVIEGGHSPLSEIKVRYYFNEFMSDEEYIDIYMGSIEKEWEEMDIYVINDSNSFINGYKIVELSNHKYGYVKEETNKLIPFHYFDIASNFNQYGLAMVGIRNTVSWINKNFEFISCYGSFLRTPSVSTKENILTYLHHEMVYNSFSRVCSFSNNQVPLSMVSANHVNDFDFPPIKNTPFYSASYIDTNGNYKEFIYYDGNFNTCEEKAFMTGASFNELGYALASNMNIIPEESGFKMVANVHKKYILFDNGIYCNMKTFHNLCAEDGVSIPTIKDDLARRKLLSLYNNSK